MTKRVLLIVHIVICSILLFCGCKSSSKLVSSYYSPWLSYWEKHPPKKEAKLNKFRLEANEIISQLISEIKDIDSKGSVSEAREFNNKLTTFYESIKSLDNNINRSISNKFNFDAFQNYIHYSKYLTSIIESRNLMKGNDFLNAIAKINECDISLSQIKAIKDNYIFAAVDYYKKQISDAEIKSDLFSETDNIVKLSQLQSNGRVDFSKYYSISIAGDTTFLTEFIATSRSKCFANLKMKIKEYATSNKFSDANNHLQYAKLLAKKSEQNDIADLEKKVRTGGVSYYEQEAKQFEKVNDYDNAVKSIEKIKSIDPNIDLSDKVAKIYFASGKSYKDNFHNYEKAIEEFDKAKKISSISIEIQDYIEKTYLQWGNDLLSEAKELSDDGNCKKAYFKANEAIEKYKSANASTALAQSVKTKALQCAKIKLAIIVLNNSSNCFSSLRQKIITPYINYFTKGISNSYNGVFVNIAAMNSNVFSEGEPSEIASRYDADYAFVIKIENIDYNSNSNDLGKFQFCTSKGPFDRMVQFDNYHPAIPMRGYVYNPAFVEKYEYWADAKINFNAYILDMKNNSLLLPNDKSVSNSWSKNFYQSLNGDAANTIRQCPNTWFNFADGSFSKDNTAFLGEDNFSPYYQSCETLLTEKLLNSLKSLSDSYIGKIVNLDKAN